MITPHRVIIVLNEVIHQFYWSRVKIQYTEAAVILMDILKSSVSLASVVRWLSMDPRTKSSPVPFMVRAYALVADLIPGRGDAGDSQSVSFSQSFYLSFSLPPSLKSVKTYFKKKCQSKCIIITNFFGGIHEIFQTC